MLRTSRRHFMINTAALTTMGASAATSAVAEQQGARATRPAPAKAAADKGWRAEGLHEGEKRLYEMPTTEMIIVTDGEVVYEYGNPNNVSYLASCRKSILSMLYGKYVANGTINLDKTLAQLNIQDNEKLTEAEQQAKVRDFLISSSGVYHPAGSPGGDDNNPERGTHKPGTFFQYNNWDFNVLGAIFEKETGRTVFEALEKDFAIPLGFQDYEPKRQRMLGYGDRSRYLAYHLFLSARDMARLGQVMVQDGQWNGAQIIPADWVKESTKQRVLPAATKMNVGYGYLWWLPQNKAAAWQGSYCGFGHFGQQLLCLPAIKTVIIHRRAVTDSFAMARNRGETMFQPPSVAHSKFLEVADTFVQARG